MKIVEHTRNQSRFGFTLIELLVVMAILGILSSVVAGNFVGAKVKARDAKRKSDLEQVRKALEMYVNDKGVYPLSSADGKILACGGGSAACTWGTDTLKDVVGGAIYMIKLPTDPTGKYAYRYVADSVGKKYKLYAKLENANDDDIGNYQSACNGSRCGCDGTEEANCNYGISSQNTTASDGSY